MVINLMQPAVQWHICCISFLSRLVIIHFENGSKEDQVLEEFLYAIG
jgi:hypothetical protein